MKYLGRGLLLGGLFIVVAAFIVTQISASRSGSPGYAVLDEDLEPLRADFNAKADHVRAVLLVGPT